MEHPTGELSSGYIRTGDGLQLFCRRAYPPSPRAAVVVVHGLGEHIGRYDAVVRFLADRGLAVLGFDQRGHGRSPGRRVHVRSFDDFVADVAAARRTQEKQFPSLPHFLVGHSQGALVGALSAARRPEGLAGLVLISPLFAIHPSHAPGPLLRAAANVMAFAWPTLLFPNDVDPEALSRDREVVRAYAADPLVTRRVSARWYRGLQRAFAEAQRSCGRWSVPTLLMIAGDDTVVDPAAARRFGAAAPSGVIEVVEWPGLRHEIFNEPERAHVLEAVGRWLDARLA
jgi:alpha-beta hydrolase superfamily lysophospholipase